MRGLCWLRRDLRLDDHHALSRSLAECTETFLVFIFDPHFLSSLRQKADQRVSLIIESLREMDQKLRVAGGELILLYGDSEQEIPRLVRALKVQKLYFNRDYEPYTRKRDEAIVKKLTVEVESFKDQVIFEKRDLEREKGQAYKVFSAFKRRWLEHFKEIEDVLPRYRCPLKKLAGTQQILERVKIKGMLNIDRIYDHIGFVEVRPFLPGGTKACEKQWKVFQKNKLKDYEKRRDYPAAEGTSLLSPYLRFGNLSIRQVIRGNLEGNLRKKSSAWLSELIWREFFQASLEAFPHAEQGSLRPEFRQLPWPSPHSPLVQKRFRAWCQGMTGYPFVDAGMRCLNQTGLMPNRVRMVTAVFLCKILLIDWRLGEKYFAEKLLDFDLAANNGNWQWCASTGFDSVPYFRIFNPYTQSEKFDKDGEFIKKFVPELQGFSPKRRHQPHLTRMEEQRAADCELGKDYPWPIVDYQIQRKKALNFYQSRQHNLANSLS